MDTRSTQSLRVLLAAEAGMFGDGIAMACNAAADLRVVGRVGPRQDVAGAARRLKPDVAIIAAFGERPDAVRALRDGRPAVPVLALSRTTCPEQLLAAVEVGAAGYLGEDATLEDLVGGVRAIARGGDRRCRRGCSATCSKG